MHHYTQEELTRITATPAALGRHIGKDFMGEQYKIYPWLLELERQVLEVLYRPGNEILIVSVPPQEGKSTYCSMLLPAWYLGRNPGKQVINISYNQDQASKWGLRTMLLMKRYGNDLFGVKVHPDSDAAHDWKMANGFGGMMSAGIRGGITGNPGDLIICDDTLKGAEDMNSPTIKRKNLEEWDDAITNRFQENTKVIVPATRWCDDDLSGEIYQRSQQPGYDGYPVTVLNFKALAEPDPDEMREMIAEHACSKCEGLRHDPDASPQRDYAKYDRLAEHVAREANWLDPALGRKYGEGLGGQHSTKFFRRKRASTPLGRWMSMHQGVTTFGASGMFPEEDWRFWAYDDEEADLGPGDIRISRNAEFGKIVRVWDIASSPGGGDWTVGSKVARDQRSRILVLDRERFQYGPGMVDERIKQVAESDGHEVAILIEKERSGAGETVVDNYKRTMLGYYVDEAKAEGDKESRATPASIEQNKNNCYLPRNAWWTQEWIKEHSQMDGKGKRPKHDDQIDTFAYAVKHLVGSGDSHIFDVTGLSAKRDDLSTDEKMHILLVRQQLGLGN
jgi:predicted phage terminase large subunit-like protein